MFELKGIFCHRINLLSGFDGLKAYQSSEILRYMSDLSDHHSDSL